MDKSVGVLGGGQLGRMLVESANRLGVKINILDAPGAPAKQISNHEGHVDGSFKERAAVQELASRSDVVTVEIEHVNTEILEEIDGRTDVQPSWKTIRTIQDKYAQKQHLKAHGVATAESVALEEASLAELERTADAVGLPLMLKSRKEAYDGRGNFPVQSAADFEAALDALGGNKSGGLYAERWAAFRVELAVMVVKTRDSVLSFPTVETVHENSICKLVYAPARGLSADTDESAQRLARKAVDSFWGKGVFGVEMFLLDDGSLLINEIAPRPHNSGHYTIEACGMSQYDAHLRAILDLPIPPQSLRIERPAIMLNILGGSTRDSHVRFARQALASPNTRIHLYGKGEARKGRKMGHVTVTATSMEAAESIINPLVDLTDGNTTELTPTPQTATAAAAAENQTRPLVAIIMGSDSDMPKLSPCYETLDSLSIPFETHITSAHRTPTWMTTYALRAAASGIRVIIAAAGGAAHLPGMTASHTPLPVIGLPIKPSVGDGTDSVLSILNMPRGVPVATVGVDNATNAALLAVRILGAADEGIRARYEGFVDRAEEEVLDKERRLQEMGRRAYAEKYLAK